MRTVLLIVTIFAGCGAVAGEWTKLPSLPDTEGFAGQGWTRLRELPRPVAAAPSPAPADAAGFSILGGDDGSQVGVAPEKHRGFAKKVIRFDLKTGKWLEAGDLPSPTVTVPCVLWNKSWVVPGGEARPGVRSPEVWTFTPGRND